MKKLTPSKREKYKKRVDTIKGKLQELAWAMQADNIPTGTYIQSAGRSVEAINKYLDSI